VKHGAAFGLSHGLSQLAALRPPVSDAKLPGLYFTGASCRPGNGVPLVLIGSKLTAEAIHRDVASGAVSNVTGK
jgi:phytoene desaturase (3,4-didehydrolycopene-forming)